MSKVTCLTEDQLWDYYIQRNLWVKDVDFDHLKDEFRKRGVVILEDAAYYFNNKGERYKVFVKSRNSVSSEIMMPNGQTISVKNEELEKYE